jgi:hypothetical protein
MVLDSMKEHIEQMTNSGAAVGAAADFTHKSGPHKILQSFIFSPMEGFTGTVEYGIYSSRNDIYTGITYITNAETQNATTYYGNPYPVLIPINSMHYFYVSGSLTGTYYIDAIYRGG